MTFSRHRSCERKMVFKKRGEAARVLLKMMKKNNRGGILDVYQCEYGAHFHIGHVPKQIFDDYTPSIFDSIKPERLHGYR